MPAPLSMDVRRRFARLIEGGMSGRAASDRLMISASAGIRLARKVHAGEDVAPARGGRPKGCGKLGPHREALREMVEANADITMPELVRALEAAAGVQVAPASLSRALRRWGFRVKKSR
jgi:transposase